MFLFNFGTNVESTLQFVFFRLERVLKWPLSDSIPISDIAANACFLKCTLNEVTRHDL